MNRAATITAGLLAAGALAALPFPGEPGRVVVGNGWRPAVSVLIRHTACVIFQPSRARAIQSRQLVAIPVGTLGILRTRGGRHY
jgi:hypothetical protein